MKNEENKTACKEHKIPKKKIIAVVISAVLIAGLGVCYFLLRDRIPAKTEETDKSTYTELLSVGISDISAVTVKTSDGVITVTQKDGVITVSPKDDSMTQEMLYSYLKNYTSVYATREIKGGAEKLSSYGIKNDENYFEITLTDKTKHRFCIGSSIDGSYYCLKAEDETVWLVPAFVGSQLLNAPKVKDEKSESLSISIDYSNIYYVEVSKGKNVLFAIKRVSDSTAIPYNFYSTYELIKPFSDIAYTTEFTDFLKAISVSITPEGHMGSAAENSEKYGINSGYTLTVKDSSKTHTLRFGNRSNMGVYMTYNDYPYVYLVSDSVLSALESADPNNFATPYIDLYPVDDVSEIVIKKGKNEYTLNVDNAEKKYMLCGKSMSEEDFNIIFNSLSDITAYKGVETNLSKSDKICSISYKLKDGSKYSRTYYDCGSSMVYMTTKESGIDCTVKKTSVDAVLKAVKSIAK